MKHRSQAKKIGTMKTPEPGFYRHYKHKPDGPKHNFMYEVICIAENRDTGELVVVYRRMYGRRSQNGNYTRELSKFTGRVVPEGSRYDKKVPRYARITDKALLKELAEERKHRYPIAE